jgi:hypothetical protein
MSKHKKSVVMWVGALTLLTTAAQAQVGVAVQGQVGVNTQAQYGAPPPVAQPQPMYVAPAPVYQDQSMAMQPPPRQSLQIGRLRYGADVGGGWSFLGPLSGGAVVGSVRLGWQFNDNWAGYYQGTLPIGFASGSYGGYEYAGAALVLGNGIMGEYTIGDVLSLGLGPSLDYAAAAVCDSGRGSQCIGEGGTYFGIQARASLSLIASTEGPNGRRSALRLGLSSHTTFMGDIFQTFNIHLGYDWY